MGEQKNRDVAKNYTKARKFPQLIGTTPEGQRLPFGPYTYTQFIGAGVAGLVLWQTTGLWATGSLIRNVTLFAMIMAGTVYGLGRLPLGGRNPLSMVHGVGKALTGGTQTPGVCATAPRRSRVRAVTGEVTTIPSTVTAWLNTEFAAAQIAEARSPADADVFTDLEKVRRRNTPMHTSRRRAAQPSPVLATSASTHADRLVAMAIASRSIREKA
ncbi:hypothetical protein [Rhodococcus opacus]|uniref:hypothetical protein n=1 Tax=Rhodococcus opacus TaxID=37919 RepID=UPI001C440217|nr:hypothetical protein [Rhodococcus opacus]MBV6760537.1 hypothetical protein [Rhodococcus opacus]